jgi:hypothetical protein
VGLAFGVGAGLAGAYAWRDTTDTARRRWGPDWWKGADWYERAGWLCPTLVMMVFCGGLAASGVVVVLGVLNAAP